MIASFDRTLGRRAFFAGTGASFAALALGGCQMAQGIASDPTRALSLVQGFQKRANLTPADEVALGEGLYPRLVAQGGGAYANPRVQSAVRRLAEPLFRASRRQFRWEITVLDDNSPNAWSLPGGKLGLNKGLLRYVASEAELAAVIAHEMGHAELSHQLDELNNAGVFAHLGSILKDAAQQEIDARVGGLGAITGPVLDRVAPEMVKIAATGYSREHEREADAFILVVFQASGYDPRQASAVFRTLNALVPADVEATTSLFSTHPGTVERIERIDAAAAKLPAGGSGGGAAAFAEIKAVFPTRRYYLRDQAG